MTLFPEEDAASSACIERRTPGQYAVSFRRAETGRQLDFGTGALAATALRRSQASICPARACRSIGRGAALDAQTCTPSGGDRLSVGRSQRDALLLRQLFGMPPAGLKVSWC